MLTWSHRWLLLALFVSASGCTRNLVATPYVLNQKDPQQIFADCPNDCRTPNAPILYATDRAIVEHSKTYPTYGYGRASSLAFGAVDVTLKPDPSWNELLRDSTHMQRSQPYELATANVREGGHIQQLADGAVLQGDGNAITQTAAKQDVAEVARFQSMLRSRLEQSPRKDVYIYVHGFNNSFDDAVCRAAEVWHFMGRVGVPIAYTWPAGSGGIRGYAYDRESSEFTVGHLRHFIKTVAETPGVERVHILAHSMGCSVTVSAVRELHLACQAQGKVTQRELKLENLVLAAPDIDEDVFMQRFVGENLLIAARQTTIYASPFDRAIELSDILFASRRRLGILAIKDFSANFKQSLAKLPSVQFVECKVSGILTSHSYIFEHPAALSDLILVLRDSRPPGAANGRPLLQPAEGLWELTDDYLK